MVLLVNKNRPRTLEEFIGNEIIKQKVYNAVSRGFSYIPPLLFSGGAGVGKTSMAEIIARMLFAKRDKDGNVISTDYSWTTKWKELNASDDRGIKVVRDEIKSYARITNQKILFLTEADNMCLPKGTEIIVGRNDSKGGFRTQPIEEVSKKRYVSIPSVNLETGEIENDKGKCLETGQADFYELTLEDGRTVTASHNHPFFILRNGKLVRIELHDLKSGDDIADYLDKVVKYMDNKEQGEIDSVRITNIKHIGKQKSWNITMQKNHSFILGNGIVTHNTSDAQQALRRIMETNTKHTLFILDCNLPDKIIRPIRSRCAELRFVPISPTDMGKYLIKVLQMEKVKIPMEKHPSDPKKMIVAVGMRSALTKIVSLAKGDMRSALNNIQMLITKDLEINYKNVLSVQESDESIAIFNKAFAGDVVGAIRLLEDYLIQKNYKWEILIKSWNKILISLPQSKEDQLKANYKEMSYNLLYVLAKFEDRCRNGNVPLFQLTAFLAYVGRVQSLLVKY